MRRRFYTPYEVEMHNSPKDCFVSIFYRVYNVTDLIKKYAGHETKPLMENAGRDISHWFDEETNDVRRCVDPMSGLHVPHCPQVSAKLFSNAICIRGKGRFVHVQPPFPSSDYDMSFDLPWWKDAKYQVLKHPLRFFLANAQVGRLTRCPRVIRMKNLLSAQEDKLEVPEEETVGEIRQRYLAINKHALAYAFSSFVREASGDWICKDLDLKKTLEQNGVLDDTAIFEELRLDDDYHIPVLFTKWMDDLTTL